MSNRLHFGTLEICAFFHLSLSTSRALTYNPKMCGFLSVWRFLLFFVCPWMPLFTGGVNTGPPSLLLSSHLPAVMLSVLVTGDDAPGIQDVAANPTTHRTNSPSFRFAQGLSGPRCPQCPG